MIDYNPCKGCDFLDKPYWSVVNPCDNCYKRATSGYITTATNEPPVEYGPVKHGRWVNIGSGYDNGEEYPAWKCSVCGKEHLGYKSRYCSDCGAKMDLEEI